MKKTIKYLATLMAAALLAAPSAWAAISYSTDGGANFSSTAPTITVYKGATKTVVIKDSTARSNLRIGNTSTTGTYTGTGYKATLSATSIAASGTVTVTIEGTAVTASTQTLSLYQSRTSSWGSIKINVKELSYKGYAIQTTGSCEITEDVGSNKDLVLKFTSDSGTLVIPEGTKATARILVIGGGRKGSDGSGTTRKSGGSGGYGGRGSDNNNVALAAGTYTTSVGAGQSTSNAGDSTFSGNGVSYTGQAATTSAGFNKTSDITGSSLTYGARGSTGSSTSAGGAGEANTGNGGDGGYGSGSTGGNGGSGVVIVRLTNLEELPAEGEDDINVPQGGSAEFTTSASLTSGSEDGGLLMQSVTTSGKTATLTAKTTATIGATTKVKLLGASNKLIKILNVTITEKPLEFEYEGVNFVVSGAEKSEVGGELLLKFTKNGSMTIDKELMNVQYLVVGGGGSGEAGRNSSSSDYQGNGGGGAEAIYKPSETLSADTYQVVVGEGGPSSTSPTYPNNFEPGTVGSSSSFAGVTAAGGSAGTGGAKGSSSPGTGGSELPCDIMGSDVTYGKNGKAASDGISTRTKGVAGVDGTGEGGQGGRGNDSGAGGSGVVIVRIPPQALTRTVSADCSWTEKAWSGSQAWENGKDVVITVAGDARLDVGSSAITAGKVTIKGSGNLILGNYQNLTAASIDVSGLTSGTLMYEYVSDTTGKALPTGLFAELTSQADQKFRYGFAGTTADNGWNLGDFANNLISTHLVFRNGTHYMSKIGGNGDFSKTGSNDNPTVLVENGATLNFTGRDVTGYSGAASADCVIRVNEGGVLNIWQNGGSTFYYRKRFYLEPGSLTTFAFSDNGFRLQGGTGESTAQIYVPVSASDRTDAPAVIRDLNGSNMHFANDDTDGVAAFVGANSKLRIESSVTVASDRPPFVKYGDGELEIDGTCAAPTTVN
ncbi:MAG: hypothetical protein MJ249_16565, partial [Kiritimatiellae bacterium]|nr:hypothetical protein [Kiritimatiellia bacterium]